MPGSELNARVVAVANLKGGVGKTTTVLNIAGFAGRMGKRVLAIDTDPQGSLSRVALPDTAPPVSLSEAFTRRARSLDGVRTPSRFRGVDLVPATLALEAVLTKRDPSKNHFHGMHGELHRRFKVRSYNLIRQEQYKSVLAFLETWDAAMDSGESSV